MISRRLIRFALLFIPLFLAACGAPKISPYMRVSSAPRGNSAAANLSDARAAWHTLADLRRRAEWPVARVTYNRAVAAAFEDLRRADSDWNAAADQTGTRWFANSEHTRNPYEMGVLFPASQVEVSRLGERKTTDGIGLPLVAWIDESDPAYQRYVQAPPAGVPIATTAVLRFDQGHQPTWALPNASLGETITIGRANHPLALDFTAGHALYWRMSQLDKHKIANVLRPDRMEGFEGMFLAQPMKRDKIPLICIHGFNSSPDAFGPMVNELLGEEWFRRNYQVWFFSYPTGVPWMVSAARFRQHFEATMKQARISGVRRIDQTVIIGHSMGGLITHASIKDPGTTVYGAFASKPIEQLDLRPDERRLLESVFQWKPIRSVSRAIFIATPHRGSPMADTFYSAFGSWLIQLPKQLTVDFTDAIIRNAFAFADPDLLSTEERLSMNNRAFRIPTVIESLSPHRPGIRAIQALPYSKNVRLHSIIGNRGRGRDRTEDSSDGVVPYWSSRLPEAQSECIVPSNHSAVEHPQTIEETKRILKLHLSK